VTIAEKRSAAGQLGGNNGPKGDVVFKIGETELARFITPFLEKERTRIGSTMITTAGSTMIVTT
jgi:hypothetical protein